MKITELQIGDWVHVNPISHRVEPHNSRVLSIRREYTGQVYIEGGYKDTIPQEGDGKWYGWSVGIEDISPIPLTPEILKKSGFEHLVTEEDSDNFDGAQGDLCYVFNKTPEGYMSCVDVTHSFTITGRIKYVHELQHILRLCGIEKEIVL